MATQLTIINNVLRRLREDTVATPTENDYSTLIAMWVNDGIRDINDRYAWESLRHDIVFDLAATTTVYDLSATVANGGVVANTGRPTTANSMLEWDTRADRPVAYVFDSTSDNTMNAVMRLRPANELERLKNQDRSTTLADPVDFSLTLNPEGDGYDFTIWPIPSAARTVRMSFWTPQSELSFTDDTDSSTDIRLNAAVVEAYVHMVASNERGEEMGEPGNVLERRFTDLLGAAMEVPMRQEERENRYESVRD